MANRYWLSGTKNNGEPWEHWLLFENKEKAIEFAEYKNKTEDFKELRVESIFELKPVWRKKNETEIK